VVGLMCWKGVVDRQIVAVLVLRNEKARTEGIGPYTVRALTISLGIPLLLTISLEKTLPCVLVLGTLGFFENEIETHTQTSVWLPRLGGCRLPHAPAHSPIQPAPPSLYPNISEICPEVIYVF
jgi:hypothetical protein